MFASAPSKTPFYLAGGLLAAWAVVLGAFGFTHPDFPRSAGTSRLVMLTSAVLVGAALMTAVTTAGEAGTTEGAGGPPTGSAAPTAALNLSADPTGSSPSTRSRPPSVRAGCRSGWSTTPRCHTT